MLKLPWSYRKSGSGWMEGILAFFSTHMHVYRHNCVEMIQLKIGCCSLNCFQVLSTQKRLSLPDCGISLAVLSQESFLFGLLVSARGELVVKAAVASDSHHVALYTPLHYVSFPPSPSVSPLLSFSPLPSAASSPALFFFQGVVN